LIDVDIQVRQIGQRIEEAIGAGGDAGRQMLEEESARIGGYLQAMRQRIPEARQGVAALTRAREPETARN
jgi:hypothetical protein